MCHCCFPSVGHNVEVRSQPPSPSSGDNGIHS
jgi:hypothetical protein